MGYLRLQILLAAIMVRLVVTQPLALICALGAVSLVLAVLLQHKAPLAPVAMHL